MQSQLVADYKDASLDALLSNPKFYGKMVEYTRSVLFLNDPSEIVDQSRYGLLSVSQAEVEVEGDPSELGDLETAMYDDISDAPASGVVITSLYDKRASVAEDIVQSAYASAIQKKGLKQESVPASEWLLTLVRSSIQDYVRDRERHELTLDALQEANARELSLPDEQLLLEDQSPVAFFVYSHMTVDMLRYLYPVTPKA